MSDIDADSTTLPTLDALLQSRRTVHDFTDAPVPLALVQRALESAHQAPNHKLTWPWRFTVVGRETRRELVPFALAQKAAGRPAGELPPALVAGVTAGLMNPAWLVVVRQVRCADAARHREDYAAVSCAVQNLMLSLHGAGVATKWSTGGLSRHPEALARLGVDLEAEEVAGFVYVGHPQRVPSVPRPALDAAFVTHLP